MKSLFDVYIAIDWSARSVPSPRRPVREAIWVAEALAGDASGPADLRETYWRTRHACRQHLRQRLHEHLEAKRRVFIGFDFGYGYPAGFAAALGLPGDAPPWRRLWDELVRLIEDDDENKNNRFEVAAALNARCGGSTPGPFWGCPLDRQQATLSMKGTRYPYATSSGVVLARDRWADQQEGGLQPIWKLSGAGSVGSQSLLGIPIVCRLRDDSALAAVSRVWPFETGFTPTPTPDEGPFVLHVEIWPGIVRDAVDRTLQIPDQAQVRAIVTWLARLDGDGQLGALFDTPGHLSSEALTAVLTEEGWILGAGRRRSHAPENPLPAASARAPCPATRVQAGTGPDHCIFCRIIAGASPASIFYQDDVVVGLMDIHPVNLGHALIIPKKHAASLADLDEETGRHLWTVAQRTAAAIRASGVRCEGINLLLSDGAAAFQEVFHVHMHVFPRYKGDSFRADAAWDLEPTREELDGVALQINRAYQQLWP